MTTCILKLSIAVFLLRIATKKSHKIVLYCIIGLVIVYTITYFFFLTFQCKPVNYFWKQFSGELGSCLKPATVGAMTYTHSGVNAFADIVLAGLPILIVSQLQMNIRTKITVCAILSLGILWASLSIPPFLLTTNPNQSAAIAVIIRIPFVKILVDNAADFLFSSTDVVIWSAIEPGLAITAANMATLRPLFSAFLSRTKLWGTTTAKGKSSKYGYGHSKSQSGFSSRRGYVKSGGKEDFALDLEGLGLRNLERSVTTTVQAKDEAFPFQVPNEVQKHGRNQSRTRGREAWDTDTELNIEPIGEWPVVIQKTVRTQVWSEIKESPSPVREPNSSTDQVQRLSGSHLGVMFKGGHQKDKSGNGVNSKGWWAEGG
jgi:hypothetical protein